MRTLTRCILFTTALLALLLAPSPALTQAPPPSTLAPRPPMGWNSWDAYGLTITEPQFRDNVDVLAKTLKPFGWEYAIIDEGWFLRHPLTRLTPETLDYELDTNGRYIPVPSRFPSALTPGPDADHSTNTGFKTLGEYVHARGLKFGIHIVRGIPRNAVTQNTPIAGSAFHAQDVADTTDPCPWDPTNWGVRDTPAGQAWYNSLLAQYAAWGVDYLKVDCISDHPYKPAEIRMIHRAILHSGRQIVLSLSPGPTSPGIAQQILPYAQMWRISDDFWDRWSNASAFPRSLHDQFDLVAAWAPFAKPGTWPDADMLPLGYLGPHPGEGEPRDSRLTHSEQQVLLTLWAIGRSPLILGANLTRLDDWTTQLLTNPDVLKVNQYGHDQRQVTREGNLIAWSASGKGATRYLALFNLDDTSQSVDKTYAFYNLDAAAYTSRELWTHHEDPSSSHLKLTLPAHSCILLELTPSHQ